jgi:hypothetical protein
MALNKITVYLSDEAEAKIKNVARARKMSISHLIAASVDQQIAQNPNVVPEGIVRQMARIEARLDKSIRDTAMLKEVMLLFVRVWLEYTPPLAEAEEDDAAALAELRFERFLDHIRDAMAPGKSMGAGLDSASHPGPGAAT